MPQGCSEHFAFAVVIDPDTWMLILLLFRRNTLRQRSRRRPKFFYIIKFILWIGPLCRKTFHDRMLRFDIYHIECAPGLMAHGSHAQQLPPFVSLRFAIAVDTAMDHHRGNSIGNMR